MKMASKDQELADLILQILEQKGQLDSYDFAKETGREHQTIVGAIKSLQSVGNVSEPYICICMYILKGQTLYNISFSMHAPQRWVWVVVES